MLFRCIDYFWYQSHVKMTEFLLHFEDCKQNRYQKWNSLRTLVIVVRIFFSGWITDEVQNLGKVKRNTPSSEQLRIELLA
jgi:hypothetical protein